MGTLSIPSQGIRVPAKPQVKDLAASGMSSHPRLPKYGSAVDGLWLSPISSVGGTCSISTGGFPVSKLKGRAHADP